MEFYKVTVNENPYDESNSAMGEPDLREELKTILYTEKRGSYFVYRRVRRNPEGNPILAPSSLSNRSAEATFKTNKGMKYLFDDFIVVGYLSEGTGSHESGAVKEHGDSRIDKLIIFLEHDVLFKHTGSKIDLPDSYDKIIVPQIDIDGNLISPLKVSVKYDVGVSEPYRLDSGGRVEFFKINLVSNMDDSIQL